MCSEVLRAVKDIFAPYVDIAKTRASASAQFRDFADDMIQRVTQIQTADIAKSSTSGPTLAPEDKKSVWQNVRLCMHSAGFVATLICFRRLLFQDLGGDN